MVFRFLVLDKRRFFHAANCYAITCKAPCLKKSMSKTRYLNSARKEYDSVSNRKFSLPNLLAALAVAGKKDAMQKG